MNYKNLPTEGAYIVFVRSKGFLAKIIHFGMSLFQVLRLKKYPDKVFNHTDFLIDGWVSGAVGRGVTTESIAERYGNGQELRLFKIEPGAGDISKLRNFIQEESPKKYQFDNFYNHAVKIFTGNWKGRTGDSAKDRYYCVEFCATGLNLMYEGMVEKPWEINPYELLQICTLKLEELS